jgi:MFS family permease
VDPLTTQHRAPRAGSGAEVRRVTLASFLVLLAIGGGTNYSLPIYLQHLTADRALPLAAVSGGTSIVFMVGSFTGLAVARYVTLRDPRAVIVVAGLVGGASIAGIGQATTVWQAYLAYAGMGISFIAMGVGPVMVAVLRHADSGNRPRTLALSTVGISLGGVIVSPLAVLGIERLGFSGATVIVGLLVAATVTGAVLFLMPPSPPGPAPEQPGGEADTTESVDAVGYLDVVRDVPYGRALRSPAMWLTVAATAFFFCAQIGGIAHVVRLSTERGLPVAGVVVAVITASAVLARFVGSWVLERVRLWRWVVVVLLIQGVALLTFALGRSTAWVIVAALLLGVVVGNSPIIGPLMVVETFGMQDYPRIYAVQQIVVSVGQGVGPVLISVIHDRLGGYQAGYLAVTLASACGCLLAVLAGRAAARVPRTLRAQGAD